MVAGHEVATRIADDGHTELTNLCQDVFAKSIGLGQLRTGLVDATVDAAPNVFDERTKEAPVQLCHRSSRVHDDSGAVRRARLNLRCSTDPRIRCERGTRHTRLA